MSFSGRLLANCQSLHSAPRIVEIVNKFLAHSIYGRPTTKYRFERRNADSLRLKLWVACINTKHFPLVSISINQYTTNGVAIDFIRRHNLIKVFAYLDDVTVTGTTIEEHDQNLEALLNAAKLTSLTFTDEKSKLRQQTINLFGYQVSHNQVKPDPERLRPLLEMPPPKSPRELKRICGMFAYYSKWIENFSGKAGPLFKATDFPLNAKASNAFAELKEEIVKASLSSICEDLSFEVECDASDYAVAATLSQGGRPVAFMSWTLSKCERRYLVL